MHRREFLETAGFGIAVSGLRAAATQKPNILFILTDDQRFDTIRALGNAEIQTPHMDRIVRRGVSFTSACIMGGTIGAICAPSRGMVLTGQHLFHVHASIVAPEADPQRPRKPFVMFPELLRKHGYVTHGIGKWHNGPALYARCFSGGENIFFGGMSDHLKAPVFDFDPSGQYPKEKQHNGEKFSSELFSDSAVKFLRDHRKPEPFCLYLAYTAPHDPRMAPQEWADMYPPEKIELPRNFLPQHPFDNGDLEVRDEMLAPHPRTPEAVREHIAAYYAMISHLDAQIGRVLEALAAAGHDRNTIIVFGGDNGLALGRHGLFGKQNLYDHSIRVPLVISAPGMPREGRSSALCYLHDAFPTLCDLTGIPIPETVESASLAPLMDGRKTTVRDSIFCAYQNWQRAVRTDSWKLIVYHVKGRITRQLFDLKNDPWEIKNLIDEPAQAGRVKELTVLLKGWMKETEDPLELPL